MDTQARDSFETETFHLVNHVQATLEIGNSSEQFISNQLKKITTVGSLWGYIKIILIFFQLNNTKQREKELRNGMVVPEKISEEHAEMVKEMKLIKRKTGCRTCAAKI